MKLCSQISLFIFSMVLLSCNKKTEPVTPNESTHTSSEVKSGYDAEVYTFKEIYLDHSVAPVYNVHSAIFYTTTVFTPGSTLSSVNAGSVSINGTVLKVGTSPVGPYYSDTTNSISSSSYLISVTGNSQFPTGSLQYGQIYPSFNDTNSIPSTINLSSGISVLYTNCLNADSISFTIDDNSGNILHKKYPVVNNQVLLMVSTAELSTLTSSSNGIIRVDITKMSTVPVGTKKYLVTLEKRYNKLNVQFN